VPEGGLGRPNAFGRIVRDGIQTGFGEQRFNPDPTLIGEMNRHLKGWTN